MVRATPNSPTRSLIDGSRWPGRYWPLVIRSRRIAATCRYGAVDDS